MQNLQLLYGHPNFLYGHPNKKLYQNVLEDKILICPEETHGLKLIVLTEI